MTVIGYDIDLDAMLVEVSRRNIVKSLVGFITTGHDNRATVKQQRLASWGSRCSEISEVMKPFFSFLYRSYMSKSLFLLTPVAMWAVRVFRILFLWKALAAQALCTATVLLREARLYLRWNSMRV